MELWRLFAHRHWFTLRFFNREVRVCARCSGYVAGFLVLRVLQRLFGSPILDFLGTPYQLLFYLLFSIPLISDWLTQSWGWRESNNGLRFFTGALLGIGIAIFSSAHITPQLKAFLYLTTASIIFLLGFVGILLRDET